MSVIIPAFNAGSTIDQTIRSVRAQTHGNLDIIVVDDGSTDDTGQIASRHKEEDPRIRVITQPNHGVARARNEALGVARGELVAPIDADDLWSPRKIAQQVEALFPDRTVGLCYTWSAVVDGGGYIRTMNEGPRHEGKVLGELCRKNFIGNGSSPLMRTDLVLSIGGYDASLRARSAQGCEDWKLYLQMAERTRFAVVPDFLTGYRFLPDAMSGDVRQMMRSHGIVMSEYLERRPEYTDALREGRILALESLLRRALYSKRFPYALIVLREMLSYDRNRTFTSMRRLANAYLRRRLNNQSPEPVLYLGSGTG